MDNPLENILSRLLVPDNNVLIQATNELKEAFKNPAIIVALISTLTSSSNVQVRQYAAILLRRKISKASHWSQIDNETKERVKQELLKLLLSEPEKVVKNSIAQVIGSVAKHDLAQNQWPDLLFFLNQSTNSNNVVEREIGMFTFNIVTSVAAEQLKPHLQGLLILFAKTLQDSSPIVASLTIQTLTNLVPCIGSNELNKFQALIPQIMNVIRNLISADEEEAVLSMEIFEELIEIEVSIVVPHIKPVILMCLEISSNSSLSENIRVKSLSVVSKVIKLKKKVVLKNNLIPSILDTIFPIMCNPMNKDLGDEDQSDDEDDDTQSVDSFAPQVLDIMALHLPPEKLFPSLMKYLEPALCETNIYPRKAGYTALAVLAEGCSEYIRHKHLHTFLKLICCGMTDQSSLVRNSALFALGQFAEYLQPEISEFHSELMPVLFDYLGNLCNQLQQGVRSPPNLTGVFFALEIFCENLDERLLPYLNSLMERLMMFLSTNSLEAKELAISAIGAAANAAKESMVPYFPQIIEHLKQYLTIQPGGTALPIQVQAIDTLGVLARTIGNETFRPMAQECIQLGLELVDKVHDPDLRRGVYSLFASVATVLETGMEPFMPTIIDHMLDSLMSTEGIVPHYDESNSAFTVFDDLEDEENIENEEDDEDDEIIGHSVENSYLEEKEDTCCALRELAAKTGRVFLPYFEKCFQEVLKLIEHPAADVRKPAVVALGQFTITLNKTIQETNLSDQQNALNQTLAILVPKLLSISREDEERYVVLSAFETLGDLFKELKLLMLDHATLEAVVELVNDTFKHKLSCQDNSEFGDEDADDQEAEYDGMLLEFAGELVPCMAKALPPGHCTPYLEKIFPCLIAKTGPKCSVSERSFSVGTLAETVLALGKNGVNSLVPAFLPLFLDAMKDEDEEVRSNGVFGLGVLVENAGDILIPKFPSLLQALSTMLVKESDPRARDNICSAVARLIMANPNAVPLKQVVPVLLRCLPLQADFEENVSVYNCIFGLFFNKREEILESLPQILKIVSVVLQPSEISKLKEESKSQLIEIVKVSHRDYQAQFQALVSSLPSDGQQTLLAVVSS